MNKYANQYLQDLLAQWTVSKQMAANRPIGTIVGSIAGGATGSAMGTGIGTTSTALTGGAAAPFIPVLSNLGRNFGHRTGARVGQLSSAGETPASIEAAEDLKNLSTKELVRKQIKSNSPVRNFIATPLGALIGGGTGAFIGSSLASRSGDTKSVGIDALKYGILGAILGGAGTWGASRLMDSVSPRVRKFISNRVSEDSIDRSANYIRNKPIVSTLPFNSVIAPLAAKEFDRNPEEENE